MKAFRIILLIIFLLADIYCLYATIGHLIIGIKTPNLIGDTVTQFGGMYIMAGTFLVATLVCSAIVIYLAKKIKNK